MTYYRYDWELGSVSGTDPCPLPPDPWSLTSGPCPLSLGPRPPALGPYKYSTANTHPSFPGMSSAR